MRKRLAISQALILVVSVFAFAYLVSDVKPVSALEFTQCCPETNEGEICQDLAVGSDECKVELLDTICRSTIACKPGCCIDDNEGLCTEGSTKQKCESDGGNWEDDVACNLLECQNGCCVIGSQAVFTTEQRCKALSSAEGIETDFRQQINTELGCIILSETQEVGACVFSDGSCKFGTQGGCTNGIFSKSTLCSHPDLGTSCEKQDSISCVEGEDEIYWLDSCGNRENIYDSNEDKSWNSGKVLSKINSCGSGSANIESTTCGNCNRYKSSKCSASKDGDKVEDGDFFCEDLTCYDTYDGTDRLNGESWCVYDASIGGGTDAVGSRHWKHMCVDGEEIVEGCADFRQQICAEEKMEIEAGKVSQATCVINEWRNCYDYNSLDVGAMKNKCSNNKHCFVQTVWHPGAEVAVEPVKVCLPQYSPGFDFYNPGASSASLCGYASQDLEIVKVKKCKVAGLFGSKWKYVANHVAKSETWSQAMNKWCTSIGDCGAYTNYKGEVTSGGYGTTGHAIPLSESYLSGLKGFSVPNPEVKGELSGVGTEIPKAVGEFEWTSVLGMAGTALSYGTLSGWVAGKEGAGGLLGKIGGLNPKLEGLLRSGPMQAVSAIGAAYTIGTLIGQMIGLTPEDSKQLGYVGAGTAVAYTAYTAYYAATSVSFTTLGASYSSVFSSLFSFSAALGWAVVAVVVVAVISKLSGCGKQRKEPAGFQCKAWEPPSGGKDCEECGGDSLHPCSRYSCKSLGAACEFVNEGTSNAKCIWNDRDNTSPPVISPWKESLSQNYSFETLEPCPSTCGNKIKSSTPSQCLEAYQSIVIGLQTDEHAKCNYDFDDKDFEEMEGSFNGGLYSKNHSTIMMAPGVKTLQEELEKLRKEFEGVTKEDFGEGYDYFQEILNTPVEDTIRLYVKCKNVNGYSNIAPMVVEMCLDPEPDTTAPYIVSMNPLNGGKIKNGVTEQDAVIYTNEPADCKYSLSDRSYGEMENSFDCLNELSQGTVWGWGCSANLTNLNDANTFYIKCKDKPNSPETERYTNTESYVYSFSRSTTPLTISSAAPQGTLEAGFEPITVDIEVKTSGGSDQGKSICYWGQQLNTPFFDSNSNVHVQSLTDRMQGNYNLPIKCVDAAGNSVEDTVSFSLEVDSAPPVAVRVFHERGNLKLITNEDAKCYYDINSCEFNLETAEEMTSLFSTEHSTEWGVGQTYYIKCKDRWGNVNPSCSIKAEPS